MREDALVYAELEDGAWMLRPRGGVDEVEEHCRIVKDNSIYFVEMRT